LVVTDVPEFCVASAVGDSDNEQHFRLELGRTGLEPGSYEIGDGVVSAWSGDVPALNDPTSTNTVPNSCAKQRCASRTYPAPAS